MKHKVFHISAGVKTPRIVLAAVLLVVCTLQGPGCGWAQPAVSQEYRLKAAFLYNFTKFVHWPTHAFENEDSPLVLCVLGDDPFGPALDILAGKTIHGRRLEIHRIQHLDALVPCHVLFVGVLGPSALRQALEKVRRRPILTVSDLPDFTTHGGIIGFFTFQSKIRFEINPAAAAASGLKISSQLLKLARIRREN